MTGLHLHRSDRTEHLVQVLAGRLRDRAALPRDPMAPITVVVGSRGMERWLRHRLATELSICSQLEFRFPGGVITELLATGLGESASTHDPWASGNLVWRVLAALEHRPDAPGWAHVDRYLGEQGRPVDRRSWALARELADVVDRYALARSDWCQAWEAGVWPAVLEGAESASWQGDLWRRLVAGAVDSEPATWPFHRRLAQLRHRLDQGEPVRFTPAPLHVFGMAALPEAHLAVLDQVARVQRVDLYAFTASEAWYGDYLGKRQRARELRRLRRDEAIEALRADVAQQNPLLTAFARVSRDFQVVLADVPERLVEVEMVPPPLPPSDTVLRCLQASVRSAAPLPGRDQRWPIPPLDTSVQVHACHGRTRQVEVLRDALLHLFASDSTLGTRDVVVMVPDVEAWAPVITGVFGEGASHDPEGRVQLRIPFQVSDQGLRDTNPVADALLRVLELAEGRLTATAAFDLLALGPVRDRFDLGPDDISALRELAAASGIRWGVDGADRARVGLPPDEVHTFAFGLERMALGVTMADEGDLWLGVCPLDPMEGEAVGRFGRFAEYARGLAEEVEAARGPRPLHAWVVLLRRLLERFTLVEEASAWLSERVREELDALATDTTSAAFTGTLTAGAARSALEARFQLSSSGDRPISGAVSVCALRPMRSVPFRVVCLLGMDDGAFPRVSRDVGFDLARRCPRIGDRDPRDEDRHLFLEAILSARSHLLVLYEGQDVRSNDPRPPCVPVSELLDVIEGMFCTPEGGSARARVVQHHPLQAWGRAAFLAADPARPWVAGPWSRDRRLHQAALAIGHDKIAPGTLLPSDLAVLPPAEHVSLGELVGFLRRPVRALLQRRLRLHLAEEDDSLADRAPIALDPRDAWALREQLIAPVREGAQGAVDHDTSLALSGARGELPPSAAGVVGFDDAMIAVTAALQGAVGRIEQLEPTPIDLTLGCTRLTGTIPAVRAVTTVVDLGADQPTKPRRQLAAWVNLLALAATLDVDCGAEILGADPKTGASERVELRLTGAGGRSAGDIARDHLEGLLAAYHRGMGQPLPLFERTSLAFHEVARTEGDQARKALDAAGRAWDGGFNISGERGDAWYAASFDEAPWSREDGGADAEFARLAAWLWEPILRATAGVST